MLWSLFDGGTNVWILTGHSHSEILPKMALFNTSMKFEIFEGQITPFEIITRKVPLSESIQNPNHFFRFLWISRKTGSESRKFLFFYVKIF